MNEQTTKWDDLRFVLAIERSGSLSAAGRSLSLSHATVFRRLEALEHRLGVRLFERGRDGYKPTPAGEKLSLAAARIEEEVTTVERQVIGQDLRPQGTVRITATDTFLFGVLMPICSEFRQKYPEIDLEIALSNQLFNLSKREADIALRPTLKPPESLVGRKLGKIGQAVYAPDGHPAAAQAEPDLADYDWVGPDITLSYAPLERWMSANRLDGRISCRVNSLLGMREAMLVGMGLTVLPCYLCDPDPRFVRIGRTIPEMGTDLWSLTHPDLKNVSRIRAFLDFVAVSITEKRSLLAG